jgi:beta-N-acetylhexosaminidase
MGDWSLRDKLVTRREAFVLGGQALALALVGCANADATTPLAPTTRAVSATANPRETANPLPAALTPTMQTTDLDTKIGQMVMLGFRGLEIKPDDPIATDVGARHLGSVVLFQYDMNLLDHTRNIQSPAQLKALNASLQQYAPTPLLIAIDQEGGIISRLKESEGFPATRSQQYYGALNQPEVTRAAAEAEGKILREMGINLNLAPVVDVNVNPNNPVIAKYERSFSADPQIVTTHALAAIEGYHAQHILTTLKHFPGHGSSKNDTHQGLTDVTDTWSEIELEPYQKIIAAGKADAIMTAHIFNQKLDAQYPATLSHKIITGILRERLGYDGVVISDDMQMGAIRQYYGFEQALALAISAGVDVIAIANNLVYDPNVGAQTINTIKQLVQLGKISIERIDQAYARIMKLKARINV